MQQAEAIDATPVQEESTIRPVLKDAAVQATLPWTSHAASRTLAPSPALGLRRLALPWVPESLFVSSTSSMGV